MTALSACVCLLDGVGLRLLSSCNARTVPHNLVLALSRPKTVAQMRTPGLRMHAQLEGPGSCGSATSGTHVASHKLPVRCFLGDVQDCMQVQRSCSSAT